MTYNELMEEFRNEIYTMKEYNDKINSLEQLFGGTMIEGFIMDMFEELMRFKLYPYANLAGEGNFDKALEWIYNLVIETKDTDDEDIDRFGETFLRGVSEK